MLLKKCCYFLDNKQKIGRYYFKGLKKIKKGEDTVVLFVLLITSSISLFK